MKYNGQLIYPNVYRITPKCTDKSIYKTLLKDTANNFLKQIAESQIQQISPFDAAAVLKRLLENVDSKGVIEIRRNPYYKPVVTRILNSVELYRKELLFYFLNKFYQLHDTQAIKHLTQVFVESQAVSLLNPNQLVELTYYAAHHIPKEVKQEVEYAGVPKEELAVYHKYIEQLQGELVAKAVELKDYNLIYKVVIALPKLPKTQYTDVLSRVIAEKVKPAIAKGKWDHMQLKKVINALEVLEAVDDETLRIFISALELKQDSLNDIEIQDIIQILEKYHLQDSDLYISLKDKLDISKRMKVG